MNVNVKVTKSRSVNQVSYFANLKSQVRMVLFSQLKEKSILHLPLPALVHLLR